MSDPVTTSYLGIKLSIMQGAAAGAAIAFLLNEGTWRQKLGAAGVGALFSVYATEGALEFLGKFITVTDATQRLGGLVFGIVGILCAQTLLKGFGRLRDRSNDVVDGVIKQKITVVATSTTTTTPAPAAEKPATDTDAGNSKETAG